MGGVKSAVYGGEWSPVRDMIGGALSSAGNGLINDNVDGLALKMASSAILGGTISEIGGGKFANGAITGAYSMLFNDLMHQVMFKNKDQAYKYMIQESIRYNHEVAGVETIDAKIIVFKEEGNTETSSNAYLIIGKDGKTYVNINGKQYEVAHSIHTHPGDFLNDRMNPLGVSDKDITLGNKYFNGWIRIIMNNQMFPVDVHNRDILTPGEPIWKK